MRDQLATTTWLSEFPQWVATLSTALGTAAARTRPANGAFAFVEHLWHLAELEVEGYQRRIDRLRTEREPYLPGFDGDRLARERDYLSRHVRQGLSQFAAARADTIERVNTLTGEELRLWGTQQEVGRLLLRDLPGIILAHDKAHAVEMLALLDELAPGHPSREPFCRWMQSVQVPVSSACQKLGRARAQTPGPLRLERVLRIISARLTEGPVRLDEVAHALRLSPRTLQRRLESHGLTLQCLVEEAREGLAMAKVAAGAPLSPIAFELGYGDVRAFLRAFKRWTGQTPTAYRRTVADFRCAARPS